jgi:hypothetical protein
VKTKQNFRREIRGAGEAMTFAVHVTFVGPVCPRVGAGHVTVGDAYSHTFPAGFFSRPF